MRRPGLWAAALAAAVALDATTASLALALARTNRTSLFAGWRTADTASDVACLALVRVMVVLTALGVAYGRGRPAVDRRAAPNASSSATAAATRRSGPATAVAVAACLSYAALALKAMAIAVVTPDGAWPARRGDASACVTGLIPLFGAILCGATCAGLEHWAGARLAAVGGGRQARKRRPSDGGDPAATTPLLLDGPEAADGAADGAAGGEAPHADPESPPLPPSRTIAVLARIAAQDAPYLAAAFAAGAAAAVGGALIPHYTGVALDDASLRPDRAAFLSTLGRLAAAAVLTAVATAARGGLFWTIGVRLNVRTRTKLFASLLAAEAAFFDAVRLGDLTSRLSADTATVSDNLSLQLNVLARSVISLGVTLCFMVKASWRLSILAALVLPLIAAVSKAFGRVYRAMAKLSQAALAEANSAAEEVLATMPTIKAHAAEGAAKGSYGAGLAKFYAVQRAEGAYYSLYALASTGLPALLATGVLGVGGCAVLGGRMSGGSLISFLLYQTSLAATIQTLGDVFSAVSAAVGSADKVVELMERVPRLPPSGTLAPPTFRGAVDLRAVVFFYPARPAALVLNGFDLSIKPGEVVALVGPSGSGKSSVCKLILRLYAPTSGQVLLDGRPVGEYDARWRARHIGVVSQEPVLYARSVKENIVLGLDGEEGEGEEGGGADGGAPPPPRPAWLGACPAQADVEAAARMAHAHDFISALPQGYETECGDRGVQLSGGQKQRIAIARALVRRPGLLLLDEATSALDATSEAAVQDAIDDLASRKAFTMVLVAHRLSTVSGAHKIVVVEGGRVVEAGPPDVLLAAGGAYAALVRRQLQGGASSASLGRGGGGGGTPTPPRAS